ncbi:MAG: aminotransferase class IV [Cyanobacteria bacterium P01_F01_bin.150]
MYWSNGQLFESNEITLTIDDPGLLYGATVFTTLRVWQESLDHPLSFWQEHCDRLHHSVQSFGWTQPNWPQLRQGAETIAHHYPVLRITIFPDGRELITGRSLPANLQQSQQDGASAWVAPADLGRSLPGHKTGNYLACWLAGQQARAHGCQEAILTDDQGNWLETSTGNLWGWADGCWWTPQLSASASRHPDNKCREILPGVGRSHLIRLLRWHNIKIKESKWNSDQVSHFETLLYTNSVRHVVPIAHVLINRRFVLQTTEIIKSDYSGDEDVKYEKTEVVAYSPHHPQVHLLRGLFRSV